MVLKNGDRPWCNLPKNIALKKNPRSYGCFDPLETFMILRPQRLQHLQVRTNALPKMGPLPVIYFFSWGLTPPVTTIDFRPWGLRAVYNSIKKRVRGRGSPWENITKLMFFPGKLLSLQLLYPSNWQFPNMFWSPKCMFCIYNHLFYPSKFRVACFFKSPWQKHPQILQSYRTWRSTVSEWIWNP